MSKGLVSLQILTPPLVGSAGAEVRRQGASVNGAQSGVAPFSVTTTGIGDLFAGDLEFKVLSTSTNTVVLGRTPTTLFDYRLTLANGARISPVNSRIDLYADAETLVPLSNPVILRPDVPYEVFAEEGTYDILEYSGAGRALYHDVVASVPPADIAAGSITNAMLAAG